METEATRKWLSQDSDPSGVFFPLIQLFPEAHKIGLRMGGCMGCLRAFRARADDGQAMS